ncbi:MAG: hypothetical protein J6V68_05570 [Clostridia bacterium]|nr:hypothetical protein [Clostridia bacterium]
MNCNIVLFALLFLLLNGGVIDTTELLILLALASYACGGLFNHCNNTANA